MPIAKHLSTGRQLFQGHRNTLKHTHTHTHTQTQTQMITHTLTQTHAQAQYGYMPTVISTKKFIGSTPFLFFKKLPFFPPYSRLEILMSKGIACMVTISVRWVYEFLGKSSSIDWVYLLMLLFC